LTSIAVRNVFYAYVPPHDVVSDAVLTVEHGESVALIGPNGSGKSTLLHLIAGNLQPTRGTIFLDEQELPTYGPRGVARRLAMVEQRHAIGFDFTVREIVAMGRMPHQGRFAREAIADRRAIDRAMAEAGVETLAERSIRTLSGGEGQRVFLAMALAQEAEVLLLDEPTTFLDLRHQVEFLAIVKRCISGGRAVLLAIHDLALAAQTADRVVMMRAGAIVHNGPATEVLTPENVRTIFNVKVAIGRDRASGMSYVLPWLHQPRNDNGD
jgi:iron complex transport system ATP-binding protein